MKYNAITIRGWIIDQISPMGWSMLIARALPELLEVNPAFSAYLINKYTKWGDQEIAVIRWYLKQMFQVELPDELLLENGRLEVNYLSLISFDFFSGNRMNLLNIKKSILNILKF